MMLSTSSANNRRIQPERNAKVHKVEGVTLIKYEHELTNDKGKKVTDYKTKSRIPKSWPMEWKNFGKGNVFLMKSQHGRYSLQFQQEETKKVLVNHSLSTDIVLGYHVTDKKKKIMYKTLHDVAINDDGEESMILLKFKSEDDAGDFKSNFEMYQGMM